MSISFTLMFFVGRIWVCRLSQLGIASAKSPPYNVLNRYGGIHAEVHGMKDRDKRSDRGRAERRGRVVKERLREGAFTPEELAELGRVGRDLLDRKRY